MARKSLGGALEGYMRNSIMVDSRTENFDDGTYRQILKIKRYYRTKNGDLRTMNAFFPEDVKDLKQALTDFEKVNNKKKHPSKMKKK